ncbi:MAG: FkbM family methyltransferase [Oscillospiraceae bacterium]|nr:FkbM family methyltransferase [Ruminococcus sp.]MCD8344571.1 FkbM family methyltransferase [Oscillospiraceae bacterium]
MLDINRFLSLDSYLDILKSTDEPIFIYGMGDGCLKLLRIFDKYGIPCAGIFASDEFVRDKTFEGHKIRKLSEIESQVEKFTVVLAFGAGYQELRDKIDGIEKRHRLFVPDMPVIGEGLFTKEYLSENFDKIVEVYDLLGDEQSKYCFEKLIEYKITGLLEPLRACESLPDENPLVLRSDEIYLDLGAYTGDTVADFLRATGGKYRKIYAVEPNGRNFRKLSENTASLPDISLINAAIGSEDGVTRVLKGGGRMIRKSDSGVEIQVRSVDSILDNSDCTYIKMDIEGEEQAALSGARSTIEKCSPKLNIAIYHRVGDLFELPLMVHEMNPGYKLFIRHYPYYPAWDTNLYAMRK